MELGIPTPVLSHRYRVEIEGCKIISMQTVSADLDLVNNTISVIFRHAVDPHGAELIEFISKISNKAVTVALVTLDGDNNQQGSISRRCKMVQHSLPFDYKYTTAVEHTIKFQILN
jgi:hypothetical protein